MYAVTATITMTTGGYSSIRQVPTFYLNEAVQGIVNGAQARKLAEQIVDPIGAIVANGGAIHVFVSKV